MNAGFGSRARRIVMLTIVVLALSIGISRVQAQTRQMLQWSSDLNYLKSASNSVLAESSAAIVQIRAGVDLWLKMHPDSKIELQHAPPQPWSTTELRDQVSALAAAVEAILKEDPSRPFEMGVTLVSVTAEASPLSPVADSIDRNEIVDRQALTAATAVDYLPGVAIDHSTSGRNEADLRMRGFSSRGQVPFFIDGIPVSMPYDGAIDFNRFLASDIAEVQVSKGFSSPLLGPNALGGSVNIVTRQPEKKIQGDVLMGTGSADTLLSSANLGSRWQKFYLQGSFDWLQSDYVPLSGNFTPNNFQPTYDRINTDTRDSKYSGRFSWTPKGEDQYTFSWINQKGEKGVPLYAGPNSAATFNAFSYRRWPYWDKTGYYLITNTGLGESSSIKFRAYYDQFPNEFDFYDNANFSTMNKTSSNHSYYKDHSAGGSAEFTTRALNRNLISASFVFRDDTHKEILEYPALSPYPFISPTLIDRNRTYSIGVQDILTLTARFRATLGFSADYMKGVQVQKFNGANTALIPVTCAAEPNNTSFEGCTAQVWNYNPQASLSYTLTSLDTIFFTVSDRGRFPLLKESYSYSLGKGIANPDLKPEHNTSFNAGYSHAFPGKTVMQIDYFYNRLRDAIQAVYIKDPGGTTAPLCSNTGTQAGYCSQNVNVARESHQGFEASIRSSPLPRLMLDANYSYLNRNLVYDFGSHIDISQVLTSVVILPTYPKNKIIFNATLRLPHDILAIGNYRYEGGITLQDTTYKTAPANLPFATSYGTVDIGGLVPIASGFSVQAGVKNLFDRNYYYTAGYPEAGRNWYLNGRFRF
jgi:iron complex outermembrane receptor protein